MIYIVAVSGAVLLFSTAYLVGYNAALKAIERCLGIGRNHDID